MQLLRLDRIWLKPGLVYVLRSGIGLRAADSCVSGIDDLQMLIWAVPVVTSSQHASVAVRIGFWCLNDHG